MIRTKATYFLLKYGKKGESLKVMELTRLEISNNRSLLNRYR